MLKQFLYLFIGSLSYISIAQNQSITFSGEFIPKDRAAAYIAVFGNVGQKGVIAESKVKDGKFSLQLPDTLSFGTYKLGFGMQDKPNLYLVHQPNVTEYKATIESENNEWLLKSTSGIEHTYITDYKKKEQELLKPIRLFYYFAQNYPLKEERIYKSNLKVLHQKLKDFNKFRNQAIKNAPTYSKEIIKQNSIILYNPVWSTKEIEENFYKTLWNQIPKNDSLYYKKPFFLEKLEQVFGSIIENGKGTEKEKFEEINTKIQTLISHLKGDDYSTKYFNLMIRFFANKQYPYVFKNIDPFIQPEELLTPNDSLSYDYRLKQKNLIGKKSPAILINNKNILNINTEKIALVFVGGNTPLSLEVLQQLDREATSKNIKVVSILLGGTNESLQNFKGIFPNWIHNSLSDQAQIQKTAEEFNLVYAPSIYLLNSERIIEKKLDVFESITE